MRNISHISLQWNKRPAVSVHPDLGQRKRWKTKCGSFAIEHFPQFGDRFTLWDYRNEADVATAVLLDEFRTLKAAQRGCEKQRKGNHAD